MPVDPFLAPLLLTLPPFPEVIEDWAGFRAQNMAAAEVMVEQLVEAGPGVGEVRTVTLPVQDGAIALKVYRPTTPGPHPVHLYLHGGGWVEGSALDAFVNVFARERCAGADCVVVAVDYRKAPEHPFPTGLEDCYAALLWVVENADDLGIRTDMVIVGGGSAGGNLAAAVALKARDESGPAIALQVLEIPALDLKLTSPSIKALGTGYGLTHEAIGRMVGLYLGFASTEADHPYASPLLAADLTGLPPAYISAAEFDPLRDDAERYAQRLHEAGVPVEFNLVAGHVHGSMGFTKAMESARAYRDEILAVLRAVQPDHTRAGEP